MEWKTKWWLAACTPQEATYPSLEVHPEFNKFLYPALPQEYVMKALIKEVFFIELYYWILDGSDGVLRFKQNFNGYIVRKCKHFPLLSTTNLKSASLNNF